MTAKPRARVVMKLGSPQAERRLCAGGAGNAGRGVAGGFASARVLAGEIDLRALFRLRLGSSRDMGRSEGSPSARAYSNWAIYARHFVNRLDTPRGLIDHRGAQAAGAGREE